MGLVSKDLIQEGIVALSKQKQSVFALILCERLMPFFSWFASQTDYGTTLVYRRSLDEAWKSLHESTSSSNWASLAKACYSGAPDQDIYDHPLAPHALNAALSVALTMEFLGDGNPAHILEARQLLSDTAGFYEDLFEPRSSGGVLIYEASGDTNDTDIHPYALKELDRQWQDLEFAKLLPDKLVPESVFAIKERVWEGPGR